MFTSLRAKVFLGFLFILLLLAGLGGYAIFSFGTLAESTAADLEQNAEGALANSSMYESLARMDQAELRLLAGDTQSEGTTLAEEPSHFYYALQAAERASIHASDSTALFLTRTELRWQDYQLRLEHFSLLLSHDLGEARRYYEHTLEPTMDSLKALNISLQEQTFAAFRQTKDQTKEKARNSAFGILIVTISSVLIGLIASYLISRRTIRPLRDLTDSVKSLQAGHLDTRIPISGADEIADLGFEFNRMTERLQEFEDLNINEIVREKQKSEAIIESINDPLLLFDPDGRLLLMNRAAEKITGLTEQSALHRQLAQLFVSAELLRDVEQAMEQAARQVLMSERTTVDDLKPVPRIVTIPREGRARYFRIRVARILSKATLESEQRPLLGVLVLFTDITHFQELDQMKSDFIAQVSHEFRTPLTSMTMSLDILANELVGALNAEQHDIIDTSKSDARRLSKLIQDLLTLARLEGARQRSAVAEETCELQATIEQLVRSLNPMFQEKHVTLETRGLQQSLLTMSHDHLTSLLSNLLSNALRHTPSGKSVSISCELSRPFLQITVADTGSGIAPEDQKRIFDKFVQLKHTDSTTPGSMGLGLAIVQEIVTQYHGTVKVASEVGKGSSFSVRLPVLRDLAQPGSAS